MKINKIISILIIFLICLNFSISIFAGESGNANFEANFDNGDLSSVSELENLTDNTLGTAISVVRIAGTGISIVILMVIACKYMIASPGDRADIKKNAIPFVIGAIVLFGASNLIGILANVAKTISA